MSIPARSGPVRLLRVAVLFGDHSNPFWSEMERAYLRTAPEMELTIEGFWSDPEKDRTAQLGTLRRILALPFDAVVVNPLSNRNLLPGIMEAASRAVPVFDVGAKTDQKSVKGALPFYHPVRTVDFFEQGIIGASFIRRILHDVMEAKVAIIGGRPDSAQSIGRCAGAAYAFAATPAIRVIAREDADFDRTKAKTITRTILESVPDVKAFFCANDAMALGIADAAQSIESGAEKIIVGVDLTAESREAIRQDLMTASVAFSPWKVAAVVLSAIRRAAEGLEAEEGFPVASILVSRENVDSYQDGQLPGSP